MIEYLNARREEHGQAIIDAVEAISTTPGLKCAAVEKLVLSINVNVMLLILHDNGCEYDCDCDSD